MMLEEQVFNNLVYRKIFNTYMIFHSMIPDVSAVDVNYLLSYMSDGERNAAVFRNIFRVTTETFAPFDPYPAQSECTSLAEEWEKEFYSAHFQLFLNEMKMKNPSYTIPIDATADMWAVPLTTDEDAPIPSTFDRAEDLAASIAPNVSAATQIIPTKTPSTANILLTPEETPITVTMEGVAHAAAAGEAHIHTIPLIKAAAVPTTEIVVAPVPSLASLLTTAPNQDALLPDIGVKTRIDLSTPTSLPLEPPVKIAVVVPAPEAVEGPLASLLTPAVDPDSTALHKQIFSNIAEALAAVNNDTYDEDAINTADGQDMTALHIVCHTSYQNLALVQALLAHDADVDAVDSKGNTPLMYAAGAGNLEIVKALKEGGATAHLRNNADFDAEAIAKSRGFTSIVDELNES